MKKARGAHKMVYYNYEDYVLDVFLNTDGYQLTIDAQHSKFDEIMNEAVELSNSGKDGISKVSEAIKESTKAGIEKMPLMMRLNYIINTYQSELRRSEGTTDTSVVDMKKVNDIINIESLDIYDDYNIPHYSLDNIQEVELFRNYLHDTITDPSGTSPFRVQKCKTCGEDFYMSWREINFYRKSNLKVPKKCLCCRKASKIQKEENVTFEKAVEKAFELDDNIRRDKGLNIRTVLFNHVLSNFRTEKFIKENPIQEEKPKVKEEPFCTFGDFLKDIKL